MKKLIFLSLVLFSPLFSTETPDNHPHVITDLDQFAKNWAHAAVTDLSREELELLGTFLCYNVAASHYELTLRRALLGLQRISESISFRIINRYQDDQAIGMCPTLISLVEKIEKEWAPSRNYYLTAWQMCDKEIAESPHTMLITVIAQLQMLGQRGLNNWASAHTSEIEKVVREHAEQLDSGIQKFIFFKSALDSIVGHTNPQINESELKEIGAIDAYLNISTNIYEILHDVAARNDEITSLSFNLINFNLVLFASLYNAFYHELETHNLLPMALVIDDKGLIDPSERTQDLIPLESFAL